MRGAVAATSAFCALLAGCDFSPVRPPTPATLAADAQVLLSAKPDQSAADAISANIQSLHLVRDFPYPAIVDSRFGSGDPTAPSYSTGVITQ
jgi:hypothetical protein